MFSGMSEQPSMSPDDPLITYTLFPDVWPKTKTERVDRPFSELVDRIRQAPIYIDKAHCPLVSLAEYGDLLSEKNILRHADNVLRVHGCEFDYDGEQMSIENAALVLFEAKIRSVLYTSPRYTKHKPRWRALFPFSEPALPEKRAEYLGRANRLLGGIASRESFTLSQSFYIGRVRGADYIVEETFGRCIDLCSDLEPQYYAGYSAEGSYVRDSTSDADLRASFERGEDRYTAMLKLSSRWASRGMAQDDIEQSLLEMLGSSTHNADGIDLKSRVRPLAQSAVRKFGESRRQAVQPSVDDRPGEGGSTATPAPQQAAKSESTQETPVRRPMRWVELKGQTPPERSWHISHWLTDGPTLLSGSGGIGKTLLAQTIATALAMGRNFVDAVQSELKVLFWACEDPHDELWRRQLDICRYFDIEIDALEDRLIIEPRLGQENSLYLPVFGVPTWTDLRFELIQQVKDYGATVLILDNIGQTFGCSENDRHAVTAFLNGLSAVCPVTVLLGHPAKAVGSEFSGSTAWENAVRMRWYLGAQLPDQKPTDGEPTEDQNVRYLSKRKTNYTVKDYRKFTYMNGVFVPEAETAKGGSFTDRYTFAQRQEGCEETILEGIAELKAIGMTGRAAPTSPDYLPKRLAHMKLTRGYSDRELRDALNRLLLRQRVKEVEVGKLSNRQPRMGLVIT
jgi:hypothetical protein